MPLQNYRLYAIVKFWLKILQSDSKKYIKIVYDTLYQDVIDRPNVKNWCSLLRDTLFSLRFPDVWHFQTIGNINYFLLMVKQRISDQFIQNWRSRLNNSARAIFYKNFASFRFQPYLDIINISNFRIGLSRLRLSLHRHCIETGRWSRPVSTPLNERKCTICS